MHRGEVTIWGCALAVATGLVSAVDPASAGCPTAGALVEAVDADEAAAHAEAGAGCWPWAWERASATEPCSWQWEVAPPFGSSANAADPLALQSGAPPALVAAEVERLATVAAARGDLSLAAWLGLLRARALAAALEEEQAAGTLVVAEETAKGAGEHWAAAFLHATAARLRTAPEQAAADRMEALRLYRSTGAETPSVAAGLEQLGRAAGERGRPAVAERLFRGALAIRQRQAPDSPSVATCLTNLGVAARQRGDLDTAERCLQRAVALLRQLVPDSPELATTLNSLGNVLVQRGDLDGAETVYREALAIRERLAPSSLDLASSLNNLGLLAKRRGQLDAAAALYRRALELRERLAPDSSEVASSLDNLGLVLRHQGDLAAAEELSRRALAIKERRAPDTLDLARSLNNAGILARSRGDLARAEELLRRGLAIQERQAPSSLGVAASLDNLGNLAEDRHELAAAEAYMRRALAIRERLAPGSPDVAASLTNLGVAVHARGDLETAEGLFLRALEINQRQAPDSLLVATCYDNLGSVAHSRGEMAVAESWFRRALTLGERLAPISLDTALRLANVASESANGGDLETASALLERARSLCQQLAPHSLRAVEVLHQLGLVRWQEGRREEGLDALAAAVEALESLYSRLGGSEEARTLFRGHHFEVYRDSLERLVEMGRLKEAFGVLERSRGRVLAALLSQRDLVFSLDIPPELDRARRVTDTGYGRVLSRLAELPDGSPERAQLLAELDRLQARQAELRQLIRAASPRLAALRDPEPVGVEQARQLLEPGTLLLAYTVGEEVSYLLALEATTGQLTAHRLPLSRERLADEVDRFRRLVARGADGAPVDAVATMAAELGRQLLAPVAGQLTRARRLVVVPDGPLHLLPFAALGDPAAPAAPSYLVERAPLVVVPSVGVLAELRGSHRARSEVTAVAFADPDYSAAASDQAPAFLRELLPGARGLEPLPASRLEAEAVAAALGERTQVWLGSEATEERVFALGRDTAVVHLACHALVNERLPLESGVAMAIPAGGGQEPAGDGLVQAWEVLERLRLDADLVVLSACATATGAEVPGEGVVGLTRAFQYAGARSVLASLWSVGDRSTAELMTRFYRASRAGLSRDQALRQAQVALLQAPLATRQGESTVTLDATHPFHWAAFQLVGDWR